MGQATDSQIAMWRGAIALLWANNKIDENEKKRLIQYFTDNLYLNAEQRARLIKDMDQKITLKDVWGSITDTQDRAHLIDIAPTLFSEHGTPTPDERALYNKMMSDQLSTIDDKAFQKEIDDVKSRIPLEQEKDEEEFEHDFDNMGSVGRLIYHIDKVFDTL